MPLNEIQSRILLIVFIPVEACKYLASMIFRLVSEPARDATMAPKSLLSLPREIRDIIYDHTFSGEHNTLKFSYKDGDNKLTLSRLPMQALFYVNHQISAEYLERTRLVMRTRGIHIISYHNVTAWCMEHEEWTPLQGRCPRALTQHIKTWSSFVKILPPRPWDRVVKDLTEDRHELDKRLLSAMIVALKDWTPEELVGLCANFANDDPPCMWSFRASEISKKVLLQGECGHTSEPVYSSVSHCHYDCDTYEERRHIIEARFASDSAGREMVYSGSLSK